MIFVSEACELLIKIHDILGNAVSKQVANTAHVVAHDFSSACRLHHEVWASQLPLFHNLMDMVPPSEACLYGCINWCLTQVQQQSSVGLSQSFPPVRDGKARPKTVFL